MDGIRDLDIDAALDATTADNPLFKRGPVQIYPESALEKIDG